MAEHCSLNGAGPNAGPAQGPAYPIMPPEPYE